MSDLEMDVNNTFATPEQFGCVGDGETDDTIGLSQAIQHATTTGKVLLLQRTYAHLGVVLTCGLLSTNNGGLKYMGRGIGHTVQSHQIFKGIRFESAGYDNTLIQVTAPTGVVFDSCIIENSGGNGIVIDSSDNMFTICNGTQIRMCSGNGIFSSDLKRATITDSHILGCTGYGVRLEGYNHGIIISNNQIFGNEQGGIYIEGEYEGMPYSQKYNGTYTRSQHCVITNNHIDHNQNDDDETSESYGIYIAHSQRANISNNLIRTSRTYGLYCKRVEYGTFSLNVFWKCGVNSMYVTESCSGCILIGNTFGNGTTEKLVMENEASHLILDRYHNKQ
jgi:parallel beta-helix repeat protein